MQEPQPNTEAKPKFDEWCLVELMGHNRIVGKCTEAIVAGCPLLRVDVPAVDHNPAFTRFYGTPAIYAISPISEEIARQLIANNRNEPVSRFELPMLAEKVTEDEDPDV